MKHEKIAEPNYNFEIEIKTAEQINNKTLFTSHVYIIKCTSGQATISINSNTHKFVANTNFILVESMLFNVIECSSDFSMTLCSFPIRFFDEIYSMIDIKVIDILHYSAPDLIDTKEMAETNTIIDQLCTLYNKKDHTYKDKIAINLTINYVLELYEKTYKHVDIITTESNYRKDKLSDKFWVLCINEHHQHRNIDYYSNKLNITNRYLHNITKTSCQMTPKQVIDYITSGTAKKLLLTTTLSNQQIADKMNFPDQSTFGQFFKRNVGMSPSGFRNKYK